MTLVRLVEKDIRRQLSQLLTSKQDSDQVLKQMGKHPIL